MKMQCVREIRNDCVARVETIAARFSSFLSVVSEKKGMAALAD